MTKLTDQQKQERKEARTAARKAEKRGQRIAAEIAQRPVKEITISIEWKRNPTWGMNPRAEAAVSFADGTFERADGFTCSGCGYDKLSTVVGQIFNRFLKYKLWELPFEKYQEKGEWGRSALPYGMHAYSEDSRLYGEGIGVNCYFDISRAIGGKFERIASGNTFDVYKFTMND
jgi:hypothetical protein